MPKVLIDILIFFVVMMAGLFVLVRYMESIGVFFPSRRMTVVPSVMGLPWEDIYFKPKDGVTLNGWLFKHPHARSTLIFAHGNAGNMSDRLFKVKFFYDLGLNVFIFDYRGYGKSEGKPSEAGIYLDALGAYDYLQSRGDVNMKNIVLYGASLGGAVVINLATHRNAALLVVESSFTSAHDMSQILYPFVPSFFLSLKFDSIEKVRTLSVSKLFIHSPEDEVVPYWVGQKLFDAASEPKEFLQIHGGHNDGSITVNPSAGRRIYTNFKKQGFDMNKTFLKRHKTSIIDGQGNPVLLKGVNFGGWLMMEAYFVHSSNLPQQLFEKEFANECGVQALNELMGKFRDNFITEADFKQVASWGMNCIRLPFHYKVGIDAKAISYLDRAIAWARKHKVYLILDLHAAYGAQNPDWHSDSLNGKTELWTKRSNRQKTYLLWEKLADRYKDETIVAGYDVLNESVLKDTDLLNEFYRESIKAIRRSDKNHILFIEGKHWAQQIDVLDDFADDNWVYSIHFYEPMEFTFNLIPFMHYPWAGCNKDTLRRRMDGYFRFAQKKQRPVHVGEFGVNYRQGASNEPMYLQDELKCFNDFGFHWTYWTYKAVKNYMFPDGIYGYYPNSPWVHRQGPRTGWNCWAELWAKHKNEMSASWRTKSFNLNTHVIEQLKKAI